MDIRNDQTKAMHISQLPTSCCRRVHTFRRGAFTLVELLVVTTIVSTLIILAMTAIGAAKADADVSRTRSTIAKIHQVIAAQWQDLLTRPLPLRLPNQAFQRDANGNQFLSSREMARVRLIAVREVMRMEFPDSPYDVMAYGSDLRFVYPTLMIGLHEDNSHIPQDRYYMDLINGFRLTEFPPSAVFEAIRARVAGHTGWETLNANAELLYLIVENAFIDGASAIEMFHRSEISDTDGDGLFEFIDAWGQPIQFIRWPSGYSGVQDIRGQIMDIANEFSMNGEFNTDPFDPLMADWGHDRLFMSGNAKPFKPGPGLFPLIVSSGLNKRFGIRFELAGGARSHSDPAIGWTTSNMPGLPSIYTNNNDGFYYYPDPYYPRGDGEAFLSQRQGAILNLRDAADNITNFDDQGGSL